MNACLPRVFGQRHLDRTSVRTRCLKDLELDHIGRAAKALHMLNDETVVTRPAELDADCPVTVAGAS